MGLYDSAQLLSRGFDFVPACLRKDVCNRGWKREIVPPIETELKQA